ncbi:MAG: hypothetical protein K6G81_11460 [Lachnospiraceae bacterium]|nr:hypothetical protein [Lachnospiraceae bacterium]
MITRNIPCFDLRGIMNSGQIFRMYEPKDGHFVVYSAGRRLELTQQGEEVTFFCNDDEFEEYWRRYFDLDRDYAAMVKTALESGDAFVAAACESKSGIRILHQDLWEMLISFIISQQKQIPSIRRCIEGLCARFGEKRILPAGNAVTYAESAHGASSQESQSVDDAVWYTFPAPEAIASAGLDGLKGLSLGYRERYIYETAVEYSHKEAEAANAENMGLKQALEFLKSFTGVGDKVANCVALFGAGYVDAFPIDTHIKDILYREYYSVRTSEECGITLKESGIKQEDSEIMQKESCLARKEYSAARKGSGIAQKQRGAAQKQGVMPQNKLTQTDYEKLADMHFSKYAGYRGIVQQWIFAYELDRVKK